MGGLNELVRVGSNAIRVSDVVRVDVSMMDVDGRITITVATGTLDAHGQEAIDLVMRICPYALEGKRMRWARHAWAFHNLVAHPALQILHWLGMTRLGMKIHDSTVPRPLGTR